MKDKTKSIDVLPITEVLYGKRRAALEEEGRQKLAGGQYDGGGDTYDDGYFRLMELHELMIAVTAQKLITAFNETSGKVAEKPTQTEVVEPFHQVQVLFPEEDEPSKVHIVSPIDANLVNQLISSSEGLRRVLGDDTIASVVAPFSQALLGRKRGESIEWVGGNGHKFNASIPNTPNAIEVTPLFELGDLVNKIEP